MKKDTTIILALILLTLATRIPFATNHIVTHDSANFALALEDFDVSMHRPHPPGYILYVGLAKIVNVFTKDANTSLIILSIFFSALGAIFVYLLGKELLNRRAGLISSLFLLSSPVFWAYGELALSYTVDVPGSAMVAYFAYKTMKGGKRYALWLTITLGVMSGARQFLLPFLFPLWIGAVASLKSWKETVKQFAILAGVCLLWCIPLVLLNGGLAEFTQTLRQHYEGSMAPQFSSAKTISYALTSLCWGLSAVVVGLILSIGRIRKMTRRRKLLRFAALWCAPMLILIFGFFMSKPGLILMLLPCFVIYSSVFVRRTHRRSDLAWSCAILLVNVVLFFTLRPISVDEQVVGINANRFRNFANFWALDYSNKGLRKREHRKETLDVIEKNFSPQTTAIAVSAASAFQPHIPWRLVYYHLPDFFSVRLQSASQHTELPSNIATVIWLMDKKDVNLNVVQTLRVKGKEIYYSPVTDTLKMRNLLFFRSVGAFDRTPL